MAFTDTHPYRVHHQDPRNFGREAEPVQALELTAEQRRQLAVDSALAWAQANNSRSPGALAQGVLAVVSGVLNPKPPTQPTLES